MIAIINDAMLTTKEKTMMPDMMRSFFVAVFCWSNNLSKIRFVKSNSVEGDLII
jgi:hypothetical protein